MTASCQTCRHRAEVETVVGMWVSLTEPHCRKFVRAKFDLVNGDTSMPLPCAEAMQIFCGLGEWEPTFWYRIKRAFA